MSRRSFAWLAAWTACTFPEAAQATPQDSGVVLAHGSAFLRWHGHEGRTYFIQSSDPADPLRQWDWAPIIESGNDEEISYEVGTTVQRAGAGQGVQAALEAEVPRGRRLQADA